MGTVYERITDRIRTFIDDQPVFFVATAPLSANGRINLSPKGRKGSLAVLDELTIAFVDYGGSHAETHAHLRENGRITLMWCAFEGPPKILRVHGHGEAVYRDDPRFEPLMAEHFSEADDPGVRAVILVSAEQVSDSCGYSVPFMDYREDRTLLQSFWGRKSEEEFAEYCETKEFNGKSIDGLPALPLPLPPRAG
ncbi:pyridoxamine 5'-phosphate oxidase family protein [Glycomyces buryatensis]|uniref:Pyridoxamine 5'-phosphate oxidase family protein n=1 Tax=Glycomyces buryatensis TaxID=2570927 RepID=A0A4S8QGC7_9ACTN|nr:pyridoxamine 5'-phosphate oxidase family protein [Glycomyces buryatensis]THV42771.1 pyridoxamine 5'-phosphate oxidase family protein [Glycomyces buryatensis]